MENNEVDKDMVIILLMQEVKNLKKSVIELNDKLSELSNEPSAPEALSLSKNKIEVLSQINDINSGINLSAETRAKVQRAADLAILLAKQQNYQFR